MSTSEREGQRNHEIRIGMSVYWVRTWPEPDGGHWYEASGAVGWTEGTRADAIIEARITLREREDEDHARSNGAPPDLPRQCSDLPHQCRCGATYSTAQWDALPWRPWPDLDLLIAECACRTTLGRVLP